MILIYITCKDTEEAKKISRYLLEKKLVACTNIHPIESMYWWDDKIQEESECVIIAKTTDDTYESVKSAVKEIHSYDTPCILKIDATANSEFTAWLEKSVD